MAGTNGSLIRGLGPTRWPGIMPTRAAAPMTSAHVEETRPWQSS